MENVWSVIKYRDLSFLLLSFFPTKLRRSGTGDFSSDKAGLALSGIPSVLPDGDVKVGK